MKRALFATSAVIVLSGALARAQQPPPQVIFVPVDPSQATTPIGLDTTLLPHPSSPSVDAQNAAKAELLRQQARQLKLENDQRLRQLATPPTTPAGSVLAPKGSGTAPVAVSGGATNGRMWRVLTPIEKAMYVNGFSDAALIAKDAPFFTAFVIPALRHVSLLELSDAVDHFYDDPVNLNAPTFGAMMAICMRIQGQDPIKVEQFLADLRKEAASLQDAAR